LRAAIAFAVEACAKIADGYGDSLGSRQDYDIVAAETGRRIASDIRVTVNAIAMFAFQQNPTTI